MHRDELTDDSGMSQFYRWPREGFSSYLSSIQPIPAYIGLVLCLLIVFILNSISFYNGKQILFKSLTVYLGVCALLVLSFLK
jgi:amino acid permease